MFGGWNMLKNREDLPLGNCGFSQALKSEPMDVLSSISKLLEAICMSLSEDTSSPALAQAFSSLLAFVVAVGTSEALSSFLRVSRLLSLQPSIASTLEVSIPANLAHLVKSILAQHESQPLIPVLSFPLPTSALLPDVLTTSGAGGSIIDTVDLAQLCTCSVSDDGCINQIHFVIDFVALLYAGL